MQRNTLGVLAALTISLASLPAEAFLFVSGGNARSGDLVAVWVKNNFELIVNLGPVEELGLGTVHSFTVPAQFGGSLTGAKFTALAVPNPDAVYDDLGLEPPPPQNNIALTTLGDPLTIDPLAIGNAQSVLDTPTGGSTWLTLLNAIPAAGGQDVIANDDDEALISSSLFAAYTLNLGFTTDAIANTLSLSTAVTISEATYEIPLYTVFQTLTQVAPGDFQFGSEVTDLGIFSGDDGSSGFAILTLDVPEPHGFATAGVALAALASMSRRRTRVAVAVRGQSRSSRRI